MNLRLFRGTTRTPCAEEQRPRAELQAAARKANRPIAGLGPEFLDRYGSYKGYPNIEQLREMADL